MRRELSWAGGGLHPHGHAVCSGVNSNRPIPGRSRGMKFACRCSATLNGEASGTSPEVLYRCASVVCGLPALKILQAGVLCRAAVGMVLVATVVNRDEGASFGRCLRLDGTCRFWSAVRSRVHRQPVGVPQRLPRRPGTANGKRLGRLSRGRRQYPSAVLREQSDRVGTVRLGAAPEDWAVSSRGQSSGRPASTRACGRGGGTEQFSRLAHSVRS